MGALKMLGYEHSVYCGIPKYNGVAIVSRLGIERGYFRDCIREGYGEGVKLSSWWSYRSRDWEETDRGLRLDHMWMRSGLGGVRVEGVESVREARNWEEPSDHVPLMMDISF